MLSTLHITNFKGYVSLFNMRKEYDTLFKNHRSNIRSSSVLYRVADDNLIRVPNGSYTLSNESMKIAKAFLNTTETDMLKVTACRTLTSNIQKGIYDFSEFDRSTEDSTLGVFCITRHNIQGGKSEIYHNDTLVFSDIIRENDLFVVNKKNNDHYTETPIMVEDDTLDGYRDLLLFQTIKS